MPIDENWFENERLHRAAADGDLEEMRNLVAAGYRLDIFDDLGHAPLHYAVKASTTKPRNGLSNRGLASTPTTKQPSEKHRSP